MEKEAYHRLLAEIGGSVDDEEVGAEAEGVRRHREQDVLIGIYNNYGGCLLFGDAAHQFYMDMVRDVVPRLASTGTTQIHHFFVHWHVLSASRFYAAFDLFKRGYFLESVSLSRTLWETALTMTAIKKEIATIEEVLGGSVKPGSTIPVREVIAAVKRCDSKIQRTLIWKNPDLDEPTRVAIETFQAVVNNATHKSKAGLAFNLHRQQLGQPIPLFPNFDPKLTEVAWNILYLSSWCLMATLSYLGHLLPGSETPLGIRHEKLLAACDELNKTPPNTIVSGFGNVIRKVFTIIPSSSHE